MGSKPFKGQIISVQPAPREITPAVEVRKDLLTLYNGIHYVNLYNVETKVCKISSGAFLPCGCLVLCDQSNDDLKLFNHVFKFESRLKLPGKPHALCEFSSDSEGSDIYVTLPKERTVLEVYAEDYELKIGNEFKTENWCYGITAFKEGLLITVGTKLKFIGVNSKFIKNINCKKIGESPFGSPCYLKALKDNTILISDSLKHSLYCIDENGTELFRYTEIQHPHDIAAVGEDMFCLAGRNFQSSDILHQLTVSGEKIKSLLTRKRVGFTPLAVCYRPADRVLVLGGECDRIKTFKLLPHDYKRRNMTNALSGSWDKDFDKYMYSEISDLNEHDQSL